MTDAAVTERLSTEGADPLTLAGVNDGNLVELSRVTGARVTLRGRTLRSAERRARGAPPPSRTG